MSRRKAQKDRLWIRSLKQLDRLGKHTSGTWSAYCERRAAKRRARRKAKREAAKRQEVTK